MTCTLKEVAELALIQFRLAKAERKQANGAAQRARFVGIQDANNIILRKITGQSSPGDWQPFIDKMEGGGK